MKISLNWIKDFVNVSSKYSGEELGRLLTLKTAEVEEVIDRGSVFEKIVVGEIIEISAHPDADKLQVCNVSDGSSEYQVVCGASNIYEGMKAPLALIGARVRWHGEGDLVEIKKTKVRGVESEGMLCAGSELGVDMGDPMGIVDLKEFNCRVGDSFASVIGADDVVFDIDNKSLTHRPDLWSHYGFAREFAAVLSLEVKDYFPRVDFPANSDVLKIEIEDSRACPRFCGCVVTGIKVQGSPQWMKTRLEAAGLRPVNNIVDVTNYVMLEYGQPMHAYDRKLVASDHLIVRMAEEGEELEAIDHKKRLLTKEDIVIGNGKEPLIVAGVMGGVNSEINYETSEIILEAANWDPVLVRQTSVRLGLRTDSSARFEKSLDPSMCPVAIKRAVELILEVCPEARLESSLVDEGEWSFRSIEADLTVETVQSKMGVDVSEKEIVEILESLQFDVKNEGSGRLKVSIPSFRATKDVDIKEDLVEEVARIYGYDRIPEKVPTLPTRLPFLNQERTLKHRARRIFSYMLGFVETMNYSFYSKADLEAALLTEDGHLQIENYLSEDQTHLRKSLLPNLLKCVARNKSREEKFSIYEIGRTYIEEGRFFPREEKWISGVVCLEKGKTAFYEAKSALEFFLSEFGSQKYQLKESELPVSYAHPMRSASLLAKNKEFARVFELHPLVARNFDLADLSVSVFEINFTELVKLGQQRKKYVSISKFPSIDFDVSVLVDRTMRVGDVQRVIKKTEQKYKFDFNVTDIDLFDLYDGDKISEDKKALAFRIRLQSNDRTLTSDDMAEAQEKIFIELKGIGGEIRGT